MKRILIVTAIFLLAACFSSVRAGEKKSPGGEVIDKFKQEEIQLKVPQVGAEVKRLVLDNGLILYLYEDTTLPLFNVNTIIRCGSIFDPIEKNGISRIVGTVMRTGGTTSITGDSLNTLLEFIGGSLEISIDAESGSASLGILSKDIDLGLKLYADLLRNPAFPQDEIDLAKEELKNSIKRRNDNPSHVSSRYFRSTLYQDHPYGRDLEWATVKNITPDDLIDYHRSFFVPDRIMIGISGDFKSDDVVAKIKQYLGDWKKSDIPLPEYPALDLAYHPGVFEVTKNINQANILFGHLGMKRDNPDRYAVELMNYILGSGSFTSRLMSKVRSDEGLSYRVGSSYEINRRDYGIFEAWVQTKAETAHKAIRLMVDEIDRMRKNGVTEQELSQARDAVINKSIFNFDTPNKIISNLMSLEYNGYPLDYYEKYLDYYRKVTLEDIKNAAIKYLHPDRITFIVVGKPELYEKPLDDFGQVTVIPLTEPVIE